MTGIILGIGNSAALFAPKGTPFDPKDVIELVDPEQPHVSVFDLSVLRGDGIFEATTVWKGFPVSLENHLRRLATSAAMTDLPEPNIDAFTAAVNTVIAAYDDPEPGPMLRILVSRGYDPTTGVGAGKGRLPSVWIFLDGKGLLLRWYPDAVDVSGDGNTALSRGPYWMDNPAAPAGKRYRIGRFISTWVRGGDGQWQVVFDGGGGNVPKPATQAEVEALAAARKCQGKVSLSQTPRGALCVIKLPLAGRQP